MRKGRALRQALVPAGLLQPALAPLTFRLRRRSLPREASGFEHDRTCRALGPGAGLCAAQALKATACIVLADGQVFYGRGFGAPGVAVGELCFNTAMTGYQEIMTDPSYAGQIVTFTFPHIGNVGVNRRGRRDRRPRRRRHGGEVGPDRAVELARHRRARRLAGAARPDRRRRHRHPAADPRHPPAGRAARRDRPRAGRRLRPRRPHRPGPRLPRSRPAWTSRRDVTCAQSYRWDEMRWAWPEGYRRREGPGRRVVAIDYGAKRNILRCLASRRLRRHRAAGDAPPPRKCSPTSPRASSSPTAPATRPRPATTPCR